MCCNEKQNSFSLLFDMSLAFSELPCLGTLSSSSTSLPSLKLEACDWSCNSNISREISREANSPRGLTTVFKVRCAYTEPDILYCPPSLKLSVSRADIWCCVFVLGSAKSNTYFPWHLVQFYKDSGHIPCFAWKMYLRSCQDDGQGSNGGTERWSLLVITYNSLVGIVMCWWDKLGPILEHIKFVSRTHMTSLGWRTSFIIDANLSRAEWWQHFLPFTALELGFIKGLKLPAN